MIYSQVQWEKGLTTKMFLFVCQFCIYMSLLWTLVTACSGTHQGGFTGSNPWKSEYTNTPCIINGPLYVDPVSIRDSYPFTHLLAHSLTNSFVHFSEKYSPYSPCKSATNLDNLMTLQEVTGEIKITVSVHQPF